MNILILLSEKVNFILDKTIEIFNRFLPRFLPCVFLNWFFIITLQIENHISVNLSEFRSEFYSELQNVYYTAKDLAEARTEDKAVSEKSEICFPGSPSLKKGEH